MVYLDYASTNPYKRSQFTSVFFNPNANYAVKEREILKDCEDKIKNYLHVKGGHIFYFRTASDCVAWLYRKFNIFCYSYEHDSVFQYRRESFTSLKSDMFVQQLVSPITGRIFDIKKTKEKVSSFYCIDATQAIGKIDIPTDIENYVDALFMSGHKIGVDDISFAWFGDEVCKCLNCHNDIKNQYGLVHGSLSVSNILALSDAVCTVNNNEKEYKRFADYLAGRLKCKILDDDKNKTYAVNLIHIAGVNGDALQQFLSTKSIYVGIAASACAETANRLRVTEALGIDDETARQSIRISFGKETTMRDVVELAENIEEFKRWFV